MIKFSNFASFLIMCNAITAASEPSATSEAATTSEAAATSAAAAELVRLRERTTVARLRERLRQQEGAVLRELGAH